MNIYFVALGLLIIGVCIGIFLCWLHMRDKIEEIRTNTIVECYKKYTRPCGHEIVFNKLIRQIRNEVPK